MMSDDMMKKCIPLSVMIISTILVTTFFSISTSVITGISIFLFIFACANGDLTLLFFNKFGTDPKNMSGKVVWVTGASSGLGEGIAISLAKVNSRLVLSSRSEEKLEKVKKSCLACSSLEPKDILVLPFDMVDYKKHEEALNSVLKHFGKLDVLVSNAGRSQRACWEKIDLAVDKELFELNVFSLVALSRHVTKYFLSVGKGHHVLTLSVASLVGVPMSGSYTGSKHALRGYFESMRLEKSNSGIAITLLCPGPVESNLMEGCFGEDFSTNGFPKRTSKLMPVTEFSDLARTAIVNRLSEAWICLQPVLLLMYLYQYTPSFFKWFVSSTNFVGTAMKLRDGRSTIPSNSD